jgi:hypothetical protein
MPDDFTHWAKTSDEAIELLKTGKVEEISLDHDLGHSHHDGFEEEKTGYTVAKFIEKGAIEGTLPHINWCYVHSQNPVGKENIKMALRNAYKAWKGIK